MRTLSAAIVTAALILSGGAGAAFAGAPDEEIKKLQAQVQELQARLGAQQDQINRLQQQLADGNGRFVQLQRESAEKDYGVSIIDGRVDEERTRRLRLRP
jgi:peptidoglycan hydrolase CwlO-like protein